MGELKPRPKMSLAESEALTFAYKRWSDDGLDWFRVSHVDRYMGLGHDRTYRTVLKLIDKDLVRRLETGKYFITDKGISEAKCSEISGPR